MTNRTAAKGWLWARTLYLAFALILYWVSYFNWDLIKYGTTFVLAPWAVLLVTHEAFRGQIRWSANTLLLFAMAGFYGLAALRNGNLSPRGVLVLALGCAAAWTGYKALSRDTRRRGVYGLCFAVLALALLALLYTVLCEFFGHSEWLPWGGRKAVQRGARGAELLLYSQARTLRGLTTLIYACGAMLVAGIVPTDMDPRHLRREGFLLCLLAVVLILSYLGPAVATVFIGRPIQAAWMPSKLGIQTAGAYGDRIWAFMHPNSTAICAAIGIFCALYCMRTRRRWLKALLTVAALIDLMALAHSQSRTGSLVLGLGLGAVVFRRVFLLLAGKRWRVPVGLGVWALTLALVILLTSGVYVADVYVAAHLGASAETNLLDSLRENAADKRAGETLETEFRDDPTKVADDLMIPRTLSAGMLNVFSNGRGIIWRECLDYLIHNPRDMLFGMGSADIIERMKAYNPDRYHAQYLHSGFLDVLARGGVFMLIALLGMLCTLVRPTARTLLATDDADPRGYMFAVMTGSLLMLPLVESLLFTDASLYNLLFFYAVGRVMFADRAHARTLRLPISRRSNPS